MNGQENRIEDRISLFFGLLLFLPNFVKVVMTFLNEGKMIYTVEELKGLGLSHYKINRLIQNGQIKKLTKKHYENLNYHGSCQDLIIASRVTSGVICLLSAASYHGLTNFRQGSIDVAIYRKGKVSTIPDWPPLFIHYYSKERLELGVITINESDDSFFVSDPEKTVIDILSFKEKIGMEETKEVLLNYLKREDRDLEKLLSYASKLKCERKLKTYLEILL